MLSTLSSHVHKYLSRDRSQMPPTVGATMKSKRSASAAMTLRLPLEMDRAVFWSAFDKGQTKTMFIKLAIRRALEDSQRTGVVERA
jgi:hypothetical protein